MILKATIEKALDQYSYKVRIPRYNKSKDSPTATPFSDLPIAYVCMQPGVFPHYDIGDIVFVEFENDMTSQPMIVGKLYRYEDETESNSDIDCLTLKALEYDEKLNIKNNLLDSYIDNVGTKTSDFENIRFLEADISLKADMWENVTLGNDVYYKQEVNAVEFEDNSKLFGFLKLKTPPTSEQDLQYNINCIESYGLVADIIPSQNKGKVIAYCYDDKPTSDIDLYVVNFKKVTG